MKHLKPISALLLFLIFSCSSEDIINTEPVHASEKIIMKHEELSEINVNDNKCEVNVVYNINNPQWIRNHNTVRLNYKNVMSSHFTIFSITSNLFPSCRHIEMWIVDCEEYELFLNRASGGTTDTYSDEAVLKNPNTDTENCF